MAFATRIWRAGFGGVRKTRKDKTWTNPGSKDHGRDGHEESVVATHSCSVQFEMFNEANAKKYILRDIH